MIASASLFDGSSRDQIQEAASADNMGNRLLHTDRLRQPVRSLFAT